MGNNKPLKKLKGLEPLHKSMMDKGKHACKFPIKYGKTAFEVLFFTDEVPFILGIGKKGRDPFYLEVEVLSGYRIDVVLDREGYGKLCSALGLSQLGTHIFSTAKFFDALDAAIPRRYEEAERVSVTDVARRRRDVEESCKIFFMGWRRNVGCHPTSENLSKTRKWMGEACYRQALKHNLSSRWTDVEEWAVDAAYGEFEYIEA